MNEERIENERPTTMRKKRMEDGWMLLDKVIVVLVMVVMIISMKRE